MSQNIRMCHQCLDKFLKRAVAELHWHVFIMTTRTIQMTHVAIASPHSSHFRHNTSLKVTVGSGSNILRPVWV